MNSVSSSTSLPKHLIVPLDFNNVTKLPDSHAWTTLTDANLDHRPVDPFMQETLPVIDLAKPNVCNLIKRACEEWGDFQVINHGIPLSLLKEGENQTRRLFSLPAERKVQTLRSAEYGFDTGYGLPRTSRFFPNLMWSESFSIVGSPARHATKLWTEEEDQAKFCEVMEQYQEEMKGLTEKIVALMLSSLGLIHKEDMKWFEPTDVNDQTTSILQLNSYPVCPDPNRAMGLAPHTDSSLLTILYQGNVSGLQVLKDEVQWVLVEPVEGALIVNVGDLMQVISNGRFKSVLHRAVVNNKQHRVTMAYFYGPPREAKVEPLKKLIDDNHPPLYRSVTWKEYIEAKSKHFRNALDSISLSYSK